MSPALLVALGALALVAFSRKAGAGTPDVPPPPPEVEGLGSGAGASEGALYDAQQRDASGAVLEAGQWRTGQRVQAMRPLQYAMFFGRESAHTIWVPMGEGPNAPRPSGASLNWGTSGPTSGTRRFVNTDTLPDSSYTTYGAKRQRTPRFAGMVARGDNPRWLPLDTSKHGLYRASGGRDAEAGFNGAVPDAVYAPGDASNTHGTGVQVEVEGVQTAQGPLALSSSTVNFSAWKIANHNGGRVGVLFIGAKHWTAGEILADGQVVHLPLRRALARLAWVPPGQLGSDPVDEYAARVGIPATDNPWNVQPFMGWSAALVSKEGMWRLANRHYAWRTGAVLLDEGLRVKISGAPGARAHGYPPNPRILATAGGVLPVARIDGTDRIPRSLNGTYTLGPFGAGGTRFYLSRGEPGDYAGGDTGGAPAVTPIGAPSSWPNVPFELPAPVARKAIEAKMYIRHFPHERSVSRARLALPGAS